MWRWQRGAGRWNSACTGGRGACWWREWKTLNNWVGPWTKQTMTIRGYNGTSIGHKLSGVYWGGAKKGSGGLQSGVNVIQSGGTCAALIWIGLLGPVVGNGENSGRYTHQISKKNHRKMGVEEGRRCGGYTKGGVSEVSGWNPVRNNLHLMKTGGSGTMGGAAADI